MRAAWNATGLGDPYVNSLTIDPTNPETLYAGAWGRVYKSTDGGVEWNDAPLPVPDNGPDSVATILAIDPASPNIVYAVADSIVFKSADGGLTWNEANDGLTDLHVSALAINPAEANTLYTGTESGVFKSTNGGVSWNAINSGLTNPNINALAVDLANPGNLYAGTDNCVYAIQKIPPALAINYSSGAPGSLFTLTGSNFPANGTATISINKHNLGTVPTDPSGGFVFILDTGQGSPGHYIVTATLNSNASAEFVLDPSEALHPQEGSGTIFIVPDGIAYTNFIYLPLVR